MMEYEVWRGWAADVAREVEAVRGVGRRGSFGVVVRGWIGRAFRALGYDGGTEEVVVGRGPVERRCRREAVVFRRSRRKCMDTKVALAKFEAQVRNQVAVAGGDPAVEAASRALLASLEPAARQLAWDLAEQAAVEVDAQLPHNKVEVTLREGEPVLNVREGEEEGRRAPGGDYEARITLRLPSELKETIEQAARSAGDSVNTYLVKDIARIASRGGRVGKSFKGTVRS